MAPRTRIQLKDIFKKNAIPTESDFADLIDSQLNLNDDGISKAANGPLTVTGPSGDAGFKLKRKDVTETLQMWVVGPRRENGIDYLASGNIDMPGRMHISGGEFLYLLNKNGVIIGKEYGGDGCLRVQGNLTVDEELVVRSIELNGPIKYANEQSLFSQDQGGSLELGCGWRDKTTPNIPYIDFHYGWINKTPTDKDYDFNVRLINDSDKTLTIAGHLGNSNPLKLEVQGEGRFRRLRVGTDGSPEATLTVSGGTDGEGFKLKRTGVKQALDMWVVGPRTENGTDFLASGNLSMPDGRMHISGGEVLYLLNKAGVIVGKEYDGNGNLTVEGGLSVLGDSTLGGAIKLTGTIVSGKLGTIDGWKLGILLSGEDRYGFIDVPEISGDIGFGIGFTIYAMLRLSSVPDDATLIELGNGKENDNIILTIFTDRSVSLQVYKGAAKSELRTGPLFVPLGERFALQVSVDASGSAKIQTGNSQHPEQGSISVPNSVVRKKNRIGIDCLGQKRLFGVLFVLNIWQGVAANPSYQPPKNNPGLVGNFSSYGVTGRLLRNFCENKPQIGYLRLVGNSILVTDTVFSWSPFDVTRIGKAVISQEYWTEVQAEELRNEWLIGPNCVPAYYRDSMGMVHLRGTIRGGKSGVSGIDDFIIFTLPEGYRPTGYESFIVMCATRTTVANIDIDTGGNVIAKAVPSNDYVSLSNIHFRALNY